VHQIFTDATSNQESLTEEEFVALLEPLERQGLGLLAGADGPMLRFLFFGCVKFDRWSLSPVVKPEHERLFVRFLDALVEAEPIAHGNVPLLRLRALKTTIYESFAVRDRNGRARAVEADAVSAMESVVRGIAAPPNKHQRSAFDDARDQLLATCVALTSSTVVLELETSLPHAVVRRAFEGSGHWRGMNFEYRLTPQASAVEGWTSHGATIAAAGATRWPSGSCSVVLKIFDLVDHAAWTPSLTANPDPPGSPLDGQPLSLTLAFELCTDLIARLQETSPDWVDSLWVLTPRDISTLSLRTRTGASTLVHIPRLSLGGWRISGATAEVTRQDVLDLSSEEHWKRCRRQAKAYLALGATREALIMLNMGVESLLEIRMTDLSRQHPELAKQLTSSKLTFQRAEEIVTAQFPEMSGKVAWPEGDSPPTRWAQLKALYRHLPLRGTHGEAKSAYARISKGRNALIHGTDDRLAMVADVEEGLRSLDWLAVHLASPTDPSGAPGDPGDLASPKLHT